MSWKVYYIQDYELSGNSADILFADLTEAMGQTIPSPFSSAPFVIITLFSNSKGDISNITTTGFTLNRFRTGVSGVVNKYNFRIKGESE